MELWIALGTFVLSVVSAMVVVQLWAVRTAKESGARQERERIMGEQIDAAHKKIREVVMPRIETAEGTMRELSVRAEGTADSMAELKTDVKTVLATVQQLAIALAGFKAANGNGHQ